MCRIDSPRSAFARLLWFFFLCLLIGSAPLEVDAAPAPGKVYLVLGSDTAVWNVPGGVDVTQYHGQFSSALYTLPQNNAYKVMDPAFRNRFFDSYNQPLKLTWWMLVGSVYLQAANRDVPIPNLMPLYLMRKYHGESIQQLGDELTLHYHTFFWSDYNGDGKYYWNQAKTFHETRGDFDLALAQSLLEEGVFPVSFRSGWHYMDNEWQSYLNLLLPFNMDDDSPNVHTDTVEPLDNVYDWSKAPLTFIPFHPSTTNYQIPGDGIGWNVRSVKLPNVNQAMMNQIFAQAAGGTDQVASLWAHLPESDFLTNIARIDLLAHVAATNYPTVQFRYCTAVEAMQRWLGTADVTPPEIKVAQDFQGETVTLRIDINEPIYQPQPFVAMKDICEQYRVLPCTLVGSNSWTVTLPAPRGDLAKVGIAATDLAGNLATRLIRFVPDDLFIDNLDPQYAELSGTWTTTNNAAWGTNAEIALLSATDTAIARWALPISNSGPYKVFVQVPAVSNAAGNLSFNLYSGTSNALSVFFAAPLPVQQWAYLGTPLLDATVENFLELQVSGSNQPNTFAVADVVKLSSLAPQPGFINDIQVEPSVTTANITWTTPAPASSLVALWTGASFVNGVTDRQLVTNHVSTVIGLAPNSTYYFQIQSVADGITNLGEYCFTTTNFTASTASTMLLDVTNVWKFTTNNLDGIAWQEPAYDDSSWPAGPGLLWADSRGAAASPVQPKGTQMPINLATGHPFPTYYFRTHFAFSNNLSRLALAFSNYIDDGAVFYLNGTEIYRDNMAAAPMIISNATLAIAFNCGGDATCRVAFAVSGDLLTNLFSGDNVLAVEVHNYTAGSADITFGSAVSYSRPASAVPVLRVLRSDDLVTLYWNGEDFTLQTATEIQASSADWIDLQGPVTTSPYTIAKPFSGGTVFYRLRAR